MAEHAKDMLDHVKIMMKGQEMKPADVLKVTSSLMELVANFKGLTGEQKKQLVEDAVKSYVAQFEGEEDSALATIFAQVLPTAIDLLVDAAKGKYKYKYVKKIFRCCF